MKLGGYGEYKDSGLAWLGDIPQHWDIGPGFSVFRKKQAKNTGMQEKTVLSLSYGRIVVKPQDKLHGLVPSSFETYQIVEPGDIIIRSTDLQNDWTSLRVGLVRNRGIITSAYICLKATELLLPEYGYLILHSFDLMKVFYGMGSGLRQNLDFSDFKRMPVFIPPLEEQAAIVRFLDHANRRLDRAIRAKRKLIALLNEQKQAIIHRAVTRGLDPNVPLKDSGIPWLGEIPAHWDISKVKRLTQTLRGKFSHRPRNDPQFYGGRHPFIQTGDISAAPKYLTQHTQTLNDRGFEISKLFPAGTLVMIITGAKTGHVAILQFDACFPDSAVGFYPIKGRANKEFLYYLFIAIKKELDSSAIKSTQENLNIERISSQVVAFPPIEEQINIAAWLDVELTTINKSIDSIYREITLLREYQTRLTADVVTGKLDVREAARHLPEDSSEPDEADGLAEEDLDADVSDEPASADE